MAGILTNEITPTIGAVFIPEHYAKEAQLAARKKQVLAGTVDTQYESEMTSGRTLHIRHILNLSVTAKNDNTIVVPEARTPTDQDVTVNRYVYSSFYIQSITDVQEEFNMAGALGGQIGYALAGDVEEQLGTMPDQLSDSVGTLGIELTMDDWETAWTKLQVGLAPLEGRTAWLSSAAVSAWRKLGITINSDYTAANKNALDKATVGRFLGFDMVESQYLDAPASGQHECVVFQKEQFILIRQKMPTIEKERIVADLSTLVVGWEIFVADEREIVQEAAGAESLDDNWGVLLNTV